MQFKLGAAPATQATLPDPPMQPPKLDFGKKMKGIQFPAPYANTTQYPVPATSGGLVMAPADVSTAPANASQVGSTQIKLPGTNEAGKTAVASVKLGSTPLSKAAFLQVLAPAAGALKGTRAAMGGGMENSAYTRYRNDLTNDPAMNRAHNRYIQEQAKSTYGKGGVVSAVTSGLYNTFWRDPWSAVTGTDGEIDEMLADPRYQRYLAEEQEKQRVIEAKQKHKKGVKTRSTAVRNLYKGIASQEDEDDLRLRAQEGDEDAMKALNLLQANRQSRYGFGGGSGGFGGGGGYGGMPTAQQNQMARLANPSGTIMAVGSARVPGEPYSGLPGGFYSGASAKAAMNPWLAQQMFGGDKPTKYFPGAVPPKAEGAASTEDKDGVAPAEEAPKLAPATPEEQGWIDKLGLVSGGEGVEGPDFDKLMGDATEAGVDIKRLYALSDQTLADQKKAKEAPSATDDAKPKPAAGAQPASQSGKQPGTQPGEQPAAQPASAPAANVADTGTPQAGEQPAAPKRPLYPWYSAERQMAGSQPPTMTPDQVQHANATGQPPAAQAPAQGQPPAQAPGQTPAPQAPVPPPQTPGATLANNQLAQRQPQGDPFGGPGWYQAGGKPGQTPAPQQPAAPQPQAAATPVGNTVTPQAQPQPAPQKPLPKPTNMGMLREQATGAGMSPGAFAKSRGYGYGYAPAQGGKGEYFSLSKMKSKPSAITRPGNAPVPAPAAPAGGGGDMRWTGKGGNDEYARAMQHEAPRAALDAQFGISRGTSPHSGPQQTAATRAFFGTSGQAPQPAKPTPMPAAGAAPGKKPIPVQPAKPPKQMLVSNERKPFRAVVPTT